MDRLAAMEVFVRCHRGRLVLGRPRVFGKQYLRRLSFAIASMDVRPGAEIRSGHIYAG